MAAWKAACNQGTINPKVSVRQGKTYLVNQIQFEGPCRSPSITFEILGTIIAPPKAAWTSKNPDFWLSFYHINGLNVVGNGIGVVNGQGSYWWATAAMRFGNCTTLQVSGLKHVNSPRNHVTLYYCKGVNIANIHINAPQTSPNTDGINIGHSTDIHIHDSIIETGDDCVAVSGGTSNVNITHVTCGPGHGISIGSLGQNGENDEVQGISVSSCTFKGTENGVRIKTWQGGSGFARNISFSDITLIAADNPIIIDQFYCNGKICQIAKASAVKVSDVTYTRIHGTTICRKNAAINLSCSSTVPCTNIILNNINITAVASYPTPFARCVNAQAKVNLTVPPLKC
ncbi:probable polygalacturonase At3g15720 [Olea europaea subsp. europaea]|uniref:Probable polygalacturonase At3g15720 n=1 Tax=Olea europaea subsp. europaea TaxID=158383 RepID=A0A8S0V339_OLEEU|nr:probable polygalacturonase At3g15720 [Olea europaea subsp. europaea]